TARRPFRPRRRSGGGGRAVMDMALTGRGSIAGRVLEGSLAGTAAAAPLPSVPIRLCRSGGPTVATAFSGPDGQFRFDELDEGTWELLAEHVRYSPAKEAVTVVAGSESSCDLVLMGVGDIRGSVVSPGGVPLPAMAIFLVANNGEVIAKERSDALGAFHFSGVPTGDHVLLAIDVEPGAEPVKVAAGDVAHCDVQVRRNPPVQAVAK
ncbi:MAG: carboxypeptidase-like regulatory domain-containing protein, partial [Actinobacteria bacterium]|nr:carboxypeptidase-like regulatory domain-containing protein [Actinomycetota bacterium]